MIQGGWFWAKRKKRGSNKVKTKQEHSLGKLTRKKAVKAPTLLMKQQSSQPMSTGVMIPKHAAQRSDQDSGWPVFSAGPNGELQDEVFAKKEEDPSYFVQTKAQAKVGAKV